MHEESGDDAKGNRVLMIVALALGAPLIVGVLVVLVAYMLFRNNQSVIKTIPIPKSSGNFCACAPVYVSVEL